MQAGVLTGRLSGMVDRIQVGRRIREARESRGLSQTAAAAAVGRSQKWWSNLEAGRAEPGPLDLARVRDLLGMERGDEPEGILVTVRQRLLSAAASLPPEVPYYPSLVEALAGGEPRRSVAMPEELGLPAGVAVFAAPSAKADQRLGLGPRDLLFIARDAELDTPLGVVGTPSEPLVVDRARGARGALGAVVGIWRPFVN